MSEEIVKYSRNTSNSKLSSSNNVDCTYVSIKSSCPNSCELKDSGCYAQLSFVGMIVSKLDKANKGLSSLDVARAEAKAIDSSYNGKKIKPGKILRLHVSGDSRTKKGSSLINSSIKRWKKRGGQVAYGYTHCWKTVPRNCWSDVSMLASIDDYKEIDFAVSRNYVPSIVVSQFPKKKKFSLPETKTKFIPCPAQLYDKVSCDTCKLCMKDDMLKKLNLGIAFEAHSIKKNTIKKRLTIIQ